MKKNVLIIRREQFGYHTDIYKWCEYLKNDYNVSTITFGGRPKCYMSGVKNIYVPPFGNRLCRAFLFMMTCIAHILFTKGVVIVSNFDGCSILKRLIPFRKMILDVRTMDISSDDRKRKLVNDRIRAAARIYDLVTPISLGVGRQLCIDDSKMRVLPLGAETICETNKSYDSINLLYIGTFTNRHIDKTIVGYAQALRVLPNTVNIHYDIVGDGISGELNQYKDLAKSLGIEDKITFHGFVRHDKLDAFFNKSNVGVSFVPITPYYEYQPVTKTFEYALSGIYTIGTSTYCNREVICEDNGMLINDTSDDFCNAILKIYGKRKQIDSSKIRQTLQEYKWNNIVSNILMPIIESV